VTKDAAGKALASKPSDEKSTQTGMIKPSSVVEPAQKEIPLTTPAPVEPVAKKELPISSSWQDLYKKNIDVVGSDPNLIFPGQVLTLPGGGKYTVKSGDTLSKIAAQTQGIRSGQNVNIDQDTRKKAIDWSKQQSVSTGKQPTTAKTSTDQSIGGMARSGARHAADLNNPTGLGWNGKTWTAYDTPEQGVAATQQQLSSYLSGRGVMKGRAPTPENVVSMWVTGGSKPAEEIQGGAYVQSVKNELARAGVKLGPKGEIPNSPEATLAITRAMVKHETAPKNREKFYAALYPERQQIAQKSGTKIS
jgi:LysM repeat protein